MTQTTTFVSACDVKIYLDDENGIPQEISGSSNEIKLQFLKKMGELQTFGGGYPVRLSCGKDAQFNLIAVYTMALNEAKDLINEWYHGNAGRELRTLDIRIPLQDGTLIGGDRYFGEVALENYDFTASSGDASPIKMNASVKPSGAWTFVKIAS